ncbi:DUF4349 domain-containing protein [Paenibacillus alkaliterrae]|uniref:DUF4349 domain-containing protein n=1 Tax=Paenibacillus alkaliterrae TaxID=320909 RepID=UPI001F35673E|nr:DUF4349 domain-containing protein [Paenibacillus alkaliterrae]MCF2939326.1 DUF4349 domain-containing protein [Paenibacillus alkaliterrae]
MYKQKKGLYLWAVIIIVIGLLAGCSSSDRNMADSKTAGESQAGSAEENGSFANDSASASNEALAADADKAADGSGDEDSVAGGGFASETAAGADGFNQKIIYTATLSMQVDELASAATTLRNAIHQSGGYILQFQDTRHDGEIGSSYTIKVPAAGFMSFIDRVEQIEHRNFERNIGGKDVSEEYVDLESRLKARELVEERLLAMMDKAVKADDLLKFSQQLGEVQEDIERIKGRIRYLDSNVSFSTVELRMYQTDQTVRLSSSENPHLGGRMSDAIEGSAKVVWEGLKLLLVIIAGALPVFAVLAVIAVPAIWLSRRRKRTAANRRSPADEEKSTKDNNH